MISFAQRLRDSRPEAGHIEVFWLGQAGFAIKTPGGKVIAIDPYLTDYVMRAFPQDGYGFKRLTPPPCEPTELKPDILLISHEHGDHFDADAIADLMADGRAQVYCNKPVVPMIAAMGLDMARVHELRRGEPVRFDEFTLTPTDCDHGALAPEALGFLMDFGFTSLYYAGDTSLTVERLQWPIQRQPEIAILPINGAFGNLDGAEAARYAGMLKCKVCIPCHIWTFPLHHGDPQQIIDALPQYAPDCALRMFCQGEGMVFPEA